MHPCPVCSDPCACLAGELLEDECEHCDEDLVDALEADDEADDEDRDA